MPGTTYFVPTDADGTQHHGEDETKWPLPVPVEGGGFEPGEPIEPDMGREIVLRDIDGLLEDLGERIFTAEVLAPTPAGIEPARLTAETKWSLDEAARFALDCAEHVAGDPTSVVLPSGASLADIFEAARKYLEKNEESGTGLLQSLSRLAMARRLRRLGDEVGSLAMQLTVDDEKTDLDSLDDPAWATVAAMRDSVLSAVETIRHRAFPKLFEGENTKYETEAETPSPGPEIVSTPWGNYVAGGQAGVVPAWIAASDAAERARQSAADTGGAEAGAAERTWQRERLAAALGIRSGGPSS